jgi:hypothetical protein
MQTLKQAHAPFLPALLAWITYKLSRVSAAMKAQHSAVTVAAIVARSGNPSGA